MPSLDEYYRFIEKQGKGTPAPANGAATQEPEEEAAPKSNGTANGTANVSANGNGTANGNGHGKKVVTPLYRPGTRYVLKNGITVPYEDEGEVVAEASPSEAPKPLSARAIAAEVAAAGEKPVSLAETALWQRLPHHLQTLARLTDGEDTTEDEVARKYYSRGFKETRRQLIERLLDPTLTLEETARVLGVCPATVRRYTNRGVLPHHRTVGQQRRFRLSDVLAFLEAQDSGDRRRGSNAAAADAA